MNFQEIRDANRRLSILRFLDSEDDYKMNAGLIKTLLAQIGDTVSSATLANDIAWLSEAGCVETETISGIVVVKILPRGIDAAAGTARIQGIARPGP